MSNQSSWADYYLHGLQFMKRVETMAGKPEPGNPVIIYNIAAMAIEKMMLGACLSEGKLPYSSTLYGISCMAGPIIGFDQQLSEDLETMDTIQMICDGEEIPVMKQKIEDIDFFIDVMKRVQSRTELFLEKGGRLRCLEGI